MNLDIFHREAFEGRHNGPQESDIAAMLQTIGVDSLDKLIDLTIPSNIRINNKLDIPEALSELQFLSDFKKLMSENKVFKTYIGQGYYNCQVPTVIQRNILENPGWYTAYTPYQAEIAQGRLEMLINFQTVISELTGMEIANASLLDEGTAAAEAMSMFHALRKGAKKNAEKFFISDTCFPQTIEVVKTRAHFAGFELEIGDWTQKDLSDPDLYGILLQYPDGNGELHDYRNFIASAKECEVNVCVASDLMSLVLFTPPGEMGADAVIGSSQRFGVPMGYGGPHAGFFATREAFKRNIPGRIIGVSVDAQGDPAYRMALQTREQHIRREKATSNICTAQVLLAVMSAAYAVYHGPEGLKTIAGRIHGLAKLLEKELLKSGFKQLNSDYFDTLRIPVDTAVQKEIKARALAKEVNFRYENGFISISLDETTRPEDLSEILEIFNNMSSEIDRKSNIKLDSALARKSTFLQEEVFKLYQSEHEMLRYLKRLENKDLSLTHSMISLGSCTMKLNATTEMIPVTWPEVSNLHPFAPIEQTSGYQAMFKNLENWLCEITGFEAVSLQPNSGAQGEYTGLAVIAAYHASRNESHRNVALIPSSAHGTNPASAVMAGMKVVIVKCDDHGNIDVDDLKSKAEANSKNLAALMVTYPSTHGVFEEAITEICEIIHQHGGQVYMDGANMNAQVGLTSPGRIGADVCHLNLHKTFCIPHGGGGPGMGPIGVAKQLVPFLPGHSIISTGGEKAISAVNSAPWGSASILPISYAYISLMGPKGLTNATRIAILNANYIRAVLENDYKILYLGKNGMSAHEMIVDLREFKHYNIEAEDIAKRLMDYGFHAPTMSFPVAGTIMIEPTESETKQELDRFCEAMLQIRNEIQEVVEGKADKEDNVLKNAPHSAKVICADEWKHSYSREKAAYPVPYIKEQKFWPSVSRIDNAYGDRNLVCTCAPIESYAVTEMTE
ncbi:MAG: aminomethyl-transferring glycine dehydrogenase [Cytophagales bacterium]